MCQRRGFTLGPIYPFKQKRTSLKPPKMGILQGNTQERVQSHGQRGFSILLPASVTIWLTLYVAGWDSNGQSTQDAASAPLAFRRAPNNTSHTCTVAARVSANGQKRLAEMIIKNPSTAPRRHPAQLMLRSIQPCIYRSTPLPIQKARSRTKNNSRRREGGQRPSKAWKMLANKRNRTVAVVPPAQVD